MAASAVKMLMGQVRSHGFVMDVLRRIHLVPRVSMKLERGTGRGGNCWEEARVEKISDSEEDEGGGLGRCVCVQRRRWDGAWRGTLFFFFAVCKTMDLVTIVGKLPDDHQLCCIWSRTEDDNEEMEAESHRHTRKATT